jgi:hypothetical protein
MSAIAFTSTTLTNGKLFVFAGTFTYDPILESGFKIDNIDIA